MSTNINTLVTELNIFATKIQELEDKSKHSLIIRKTDFEHYSDLVYLYTKTREAIFDHQLMTLKKRSIWKILFSKN